MNPNGFLYPENLTPSGPSQDFLGSARSSGPQPPRVSDNSHAGVYANVNVDAVGLQASATVDQPNAGPHAHSVVDLNNWYGDNTSVVPSLAQFSRDAAGLARRGPVTSSADIGVRSAISSPLPVARSTFVSAITLQRAPTPNAVSGNYHVAVRDADVARHPSASSSSSIAAASVLASVRVPSIRPTASTIGGAGGTDRTPAHSYQHHYLDGGNSAPSTLGVGIDHLFPPSMLVPAAGLPLPPPTSPSPSSLPARAPSEPSALMAASVMMTKGGASYAVAAQLPSPNRLLLAAGEGTNAATLASQHLSHLPPSTAVLAQRLQEMADDGSADHAAHVRTPLQPQQPSEADHAVDENGTVSVCRVRSAVLDGCNTYAAPPAGDDVALVDETAGAAVDAAHDVDDNLEEDDDVQTQPASVPFHFPPLINRGSAVADDDDTGAGDAVQPDTRMQESDGLRVPPGQPPVSSRPTPASSMRRIVGAWPTKQGLMVRLTHGDVASGGDGWAQYAVVGATEAGHPLRQRYPSWCYGTPNRSVDATSSNSGAPQPLFVRPQPQPPPSTSALSSTAVVVDPWVEHDPSSDPFLARLMANSNKCANVKQPPKRTWRRSAVIATKITGSGDSGASGGGWELTWHGPHPDVPGQTAAGAGAGTGGTGATGGNGDGTHASSGMVAAGSKRHLDGDEGHDDQSTVKWLRDDGDGGGNDALKAEDEQEEDAAWRRASAYLSRAYAGAHAYPRIDDLTDDDHGASAAAADVDDDVAEWTYFLPHRQHRHHRRNNANSAAETRDDGEWAWPWSDEEEVDAKAVVMEDGDENCGSGGVDQRGAGVIEWQEQPQQQQPQPIRRSNAVAATVFGDDDGRGGAGAGKRKRGTAAGAAVTTNAPFARAPEVCSVRVPPVPTFLTPSPTPLEAAVLRGTAALQQSTPAATAGAAVAPLPVPRSNALLDLPTFVSPTQAPPGSLVQQQQHHDGMSPAHSASSNGEAYDAAVFNNDGGDGAAHDDGRLPSTDAARQHQPAGVPSPAVVMDEATQVPGSGFAGASGAAGHAAGSGEHVLHSHSVGGSQYRQAAPQADTMYVASSYVVAMALGGAGDVAPDGDGGTPSRDAGADDVHATQTADASADASGARNSGQLGTQPVTTTEIDGDVAPSRALIPTQLAADTDQTRALNDACDDAVVCGVDAAGDAAVEDGNDDRVDDDGDDSDTTQPVGIGADASGHEVEDSDAAADVDGGHSHPPATQVVSPTVAWRNSHNHAAAYPSDDTAMVIGDAAAVDEGVLPSAVHVEADDGTTAVAVSGDHVDVVTDTYRPSLTQGGGESAGYSYHHQAHWYPARPADGACSNGGGVGASSFSHGHIVGGIEVDDEAGYDGGDDVAEVGIEPSVQVLLDETAGRGPSPTSAAAGITTSSRNMFAASQSQQARRPQRKRLRKLADHDQDGDGDDADAAAPVADVAAVNTLVGSSARTVAKLSAAAASGSTAPDQGLNSRANQTLAGSGDAAGTSGRPPSSSSSSAAAAVAMSRARPKAPEATTVAVAASTAVASPHRPAYNTRRASLVAASAVGTGSAPVSTADVKPARAGTRGSTRDREADGKKAVTSDGPASSSAVVTAARRSSAATTEAAGSRMEGSGRGADNGHGKAVRFSPSIPDALASAGPGGHMGGRSKRSWSSAEAAGSSSTSPGTTTLTRPSAPSTGVLARIIAGGINSSGIESGSRVSAAAGSTGADRGVSIIASGALHRSRHLPSTNPSSIWAKAKGVAVMPASSSASAHAALPWLEAGAGAVDGPAGAASVAGLGEFDVAADQAASSSGAPTSSGRPSRTQSAAASAQTGSSSKAPAASHRENRRPSEHGTRSRPGAATSPARTTSAPTGETSSVLTVQPATYGRKAPAAAPSGMKRIVSPLASAAVSPSPQQAAGQTRGKRLQAMAAAKAVKRAVKWAAKPTSR